MPKEQMRSQPTEPVETTETTETVERTEPDAGSRREQAIARSLNAARERAETRLQRFLDAATELFDSASGKDFTVQEVVDRSGQSFRSFYQYFGGKHDLLLILFEEAVGSTTAYLRDQIAHEDRPLERLHSFVIEYHRLCRPIDDGLREMHPWSPFMAAFAQQLLTQYPKEAARAFAPLVALFGAVLDDAASTGAVQDGVCDAPTVGIVLEAIMFNPFSSTISGMSARPPGEDPAEELWDLIFKGIGTKSGTPPSS